MDPIQASRPKLVARNVNALHDASATFGDRMADAIAELGGSWTFILLFVAVLALWVGLNSLALLLPPFDPYPFIFLNLVLSCLAALQAPVIMMSQNRQAARDRLAAEHDYEINRKAEGEIAALHQKLDALRESQWTELVRLQQSQIAMLEHLLDANRRRESGVTARTRSALPVVQLAAEPTPDDQRPQGRQPRDGRRARAFSDPGGASRPGLAARHRMPTPGGNAP